MALEVAIEKRLANFQLSVKFKTDSKPLGLLGSSGSGKTMTLRVIAGLETPDTGRIILHDRVLFDSEHGIHVPARDRRIGFLFQNFALFPHLTVAQNVAFGLSRLPAGERANRVKRQLIAAHLEGLEERYPAMLSGGEQQRVALARALATEPDALLLDEPFSALDTHLRGALERQLRETLDSYRGSTLFVSHNLEEAYRVCENLVVLSKGRIAASGPKEEIFRHPPTMEVARLTGCKNFSRARQLSDGTATEPAATIEALDWGCVLRVSQKFTQAPVHIAIRAHHVRLHPREATLSERANIFPCRLVAMSETPFRVTLDLRMAQAPAGAGEFHLQAEVFKQEWDAFRDTPQPWQVELAPDQLFLLPD